MQVSAWTALAILAAGFGLKSLVDAAWEWYSQRPRTMITARDYFRPCTGCTITKTSEIGQRIRRVVVRAYGQIRKGRSHRAPAELMVSYIDFDEVEARVLDGQLNGKQLERLRKECK